MLTACPGSPGLTLSTAVRIFLRPSVYSSPLILLYRLAVPHLSRVPSLLFPMRCQFAFCLLGQDMKTWHFFKTFNLGSIIVAVYNNSCWLLSGNIRIYKYTYVFFFPVGAETGVSPDESC